MNANTLSVSAGPSTPPKKDKMSKAVKDKPLPASEEVKDAAYLKATSAVKQPPTKGASKESKDACRIALI